MALVGPVLVGVRVLAVCIWFALMLCVGGSLFGVRRLELVGVCFGVVVIVVAFVGLLAVMP